MSDADQRLADAQARAAAARERMTATLGDIQDRLHPATLAKNAARDIADASVDAAQAGVDTVRRNPALVAGVAAAAGLFLARHRIMGLVHGKDGPKKKR